jgi:hypothetical protein
MKMKLATMLALAVALWIARDAQAGIYTSTTAYNIADYPLAGTSSSISIASPGVGVSSLSFTIVGNGGNAWAGDYTIALQYTDGTTTLSQTLFSGLLDGAAANNGFNNVTLTAAGGPDISTGASTTSTTPIAGTYGVNYSTFNGVSGPGNWILYVTDNQAGDSGTLTGWSLTTLEAVPEPVNVALGIFGGVMGVVVLQRKLGKQKVESKS